MKKLSILIMMVLFMMSAMIMTACGSDDETEEKPTVEDDTKTEDDETTEEDVATEDDETTEGNVTEEEPKEDDDEKPEEIVQPETCPEWSEELVEGVCQVTGTFTEDITFTSNFVWVLEGSVSIGETDEDPAAAIKTATLTIEAGTRIESNPGRNFLVINRGSKIMAEGTKENPIIFSSANETGSRARGDWGGLLINGWAPINCAEAVSPCQRQAETGVEWYGGEKADDSSGVLKYVVIEFGGYKINSEKEFNGLTLQGVGSKTTIDYVQIHKNEDDGVEFFGGTVNVKHMVLTGNADDSLDWTYGWKGNVQYVFIKQDDDAGDRGFEADNNSKKLDDTPRSEPTISNITMIGANGSKGETIGMLLREGTAAHIHNAVVTGFLKGCLDIDQEETFNNAGGADNPTNLTMVNTVVHCDKNFIEDDDDSFTQPWKVEDWFNNQDGNSATDPMLDGHMPKADSPLLGNGAKPSDSFFDDVDYIGAFKDADWTESWISTVEN